MAPRCLAQIALANEATFSCCFSLTSSLDHDLIENALFRGLVHNYPFTIVALEKHLSFGCNSDFWSIGGGKMFLTKASGEFAIVVDGKIKDDADYIEYPEVRIGDQTFKRVRVNESLNRYLRQDLRRHHATFGLVNQRRFVWIVLIVYFFNTPLISFNAGVFILGTLFYAGILVFVLRQARWRVKWINVDGEEIHRE